MAKFDMVKVQSSISGWSARPLGKHTKLQVNLNLLSRPHVSFTSVSGLCHPGISFLFHIRMQHCRRRSATDGVEF